MLTPRLSARNLAVCSSILTLVLASRTWADETDAALENDGAPLTAPFLAEVKAAVARAHLRPDADSPEVGLLREGAIVTVTACRPDCAALKGWGLLGTDGAVELDRLSPLREPAEASAGAPTAANLWYGRVGKSGVKICREPRLRGPLLTRKRISREMAFSPNVDLQRTGWLERAEGGFVRAGRVATLTPSRFQGEARPMLPLAFVVRELHGRTDRANDFHRCDRMPVRGFDARRVATDRGPLPRSAVRIVTQHSAPPSIPVGAKWVLVDLSQQTLTAYEGDSAVYATLISSGTNHDKSETNAGLFRVEHKLAYSDMHGEPDDPYVVDRVPDALYYHKNEALHGTYWHDRFGSPASHGCINLLLADAQWLFDWSPPTLPGNWITINPWEAGLASLWVLVEKRANAPSRTPQPPSAEHSLAPLARVNPPISIGHAQAGTESR